MWSYLGEDSEMIYFEYVQQLKHLPFPLEELKNRLDSRPIKRYAYCVHDKDTYEDGTPKEPHVHVEGECNTSQNLATIASWFDDKPERIEKGKSKSKKFMYQNMCGYLVHETQNSDGKYQYPYEEVVSNFDFPAFLHQAQEEIEQAKQYKKSLPYADLLQDICDNKIPRLKLSNYINDIDRIKYQKNIDAAYKIRDERLAKEVDREMKVMYFCGPSESGKTTMAKVIAKKQGYDVFVTGSSNDPLQGYLGQECIIFDDVRGSDWKINDLLKILDNNTNSLGKSRYSNKLLSDCKLMILTSVQSIESLYESLGQRETEPIIQLKRRCSILVEFTPSKMKFYQYSSAEQDYVYISTQINPVPTMKWASENKEYVDDMIGMVKDIAKENGVDIAKQLEESQEDVKLYGEIEGQVSFDDNNPFE